MMKLSRKHALILACGIGGVLIVGVVLWIVIFTGSKSVESLIGDLQNPKPRVRHAAAKTLGDLGPKAKPAVPALIVALNDNESRVRYAALKALSKCEPDHSEGIAAVPALTTLLDDQEKDVRYFAVKALA